MASFSFKKRFKDKIDRIGKDGVPEIDSYKAIEKQDIPESKIHMPFSRLMPPPIKIMITSKLSTSQRMTPESNNIIYRSISPYKFFPQVKLSPVRNFETYSSRSKSPLQSNPTPEPDKHLDISASCVKLPRINSGLKDLRLNMKKKQF